MKAVINAEYNKTHLPNLRHGVYYFLNTGMKPCFKCDEYSKCEHAKENGNCAYIMMFQEAKIKEIMSLPHIRPEDEDVVRSYVKEMIIQGLIDDFIGKNGLFVKKGNAVDIQPILRVRWTSAGQLSRLSDRLGLNPVARASLGINNIVGNFDLALEATKVSEADNDTTNKDTAV